MFHIMNKAGLLCYCLIQTYAINEIYIMLWISFTLRICIKHIRIFSNLTYVCHGLEYGSFSFNMWEIFFFLDKNIYGSVFHIFKLIKCKKTWVFLQLLSILIVFSKIFNRFSLREVVITAFLSFLELWVFSTLFFKFLNKLLLLLSSPKKPNMKKFEVCFFTWRKKYTNAAYIHFCNVTLSCLDVYLFSTHENRSFLWLVNNSEYKLTSCVMFLLVLVG